MTVHAFPSRHPGKPYRAYQQHQWSEALRCLRDCRVVRASGSAAERFHALMAIGYAESAGPYNWRLTDLGAERAAEHAFAEYRRSSVTPYAHSVGGAFYADAAIAIHGASKISEQGNFRHRATSVGEVM